MSGRVLGYVCRVPHIYKCCFGTGECWVVLRNVRGVLENIGGVVGNVGEVLRNVS